MRIQITRQPCVRTRQPNAEATKQQSSQTQAPPPMAKIVGLARWQIPFGLWFNPPALLSEVFYVATLQLRQRNKSRQTSQQIRPSDCEHLAEFETERRPSPRFSSFRATAFRSPMMTELLTSSLASSNCSNRLRSR